MTYLPDEHEKQIAKLQAEIAQLRLWTGPKTDLKCRNCLRQPIYGSFETVGEDGMALCKDCRITRQILEIRSELDQLRQRSTRIVSENSAIHKQNYKLRQALKMALETLDWIELHSADAESSARIEDAIDAIQKTISTASFVDAMRSQEGK